MNSVHPPVRTNPFLIRSPFRSSLQSRLFDLIKQPFCTISGLGTLSNMYDNLAVTERPQAFNRQMLDALSITYSITDQDLARVPAEGPLVIVANHPSGAAEGMVMIDLLSKVRDDVKILVNQDLVGVPELQEMLICVDISEQPGSARRNVQGLRQAIAWLKAGHALVTFPAGAVSHYNLRQRRVTDPDWKLSISRLIRLTGAAVSPVHFRCRRHGPIFQMAGLVHPVLRTMLLPRQLLRQRGRTLTVRVGSVLSAPSIQRLADDERLTRYLRFRTYLLAHRVDEVVSLTAQTKRTRQEREAIAIAPAEPSWLLAEELARLPQEQILLTTEDRVVGYARAAQAPALMREIGRLREVTFRAVGEGTGACRDLDRFDEYYQQLFVWDSQAGELVGAYRIGLVDEIVASRGIAGLYTASLFRCQPELFQRLGKAIELGRSFVQPKYQRNYSSLLMLWKGIGHYVARNPDHHLLFGAVSISNDYQGVSRQFMARYLSQFVQDAELGSLVKPRHPFRWETSGEANPQDLLPELGDLDEINSWIVEIEPDQKGIPILIKHYLKLGGRILAMSLDPEFGNVLDGLIKVDLSQSDPKLLGRYMGKDGMRSFQAHLAATALPIT